MNKSDFCILISETAVKYSLEPSILEKDFWVYQVLDYLFNYCNFKEALYFKGGTSLSKVYKTIERFSEDIDLVLDWRILGYTNLEPSADRSRTKQAKFNLEIIEKTNIFLNEILNELQSDFCKYLNNKSLLFDDWDFSIATLENSDSKLIKLCYPTYFKPEYFSTDIKLEIGALASTVPFEYKEITSYLTSYLSENNSIPEVSTIFSQSSKVRVIELKRTFYEKLTILHREAMRTNGNYPSRYARHFYDIYKIIKNRNNVDISYNKELMKEIFDFKDKFYYCAWTKYPMILETGLKLIPNDEAIAIFKEDYKEMQGMIFENPKPTFDEIIEIIKSYEHEINQLILLG